MLRLTRDVEQVVRKCGRKPHIASFLNVVNVRDRSPDACVSIEEKRRESSIVQKDSSRSSSRGRLHEMFDGGTAQSASIRRLSPAQSENELNGVLEMPSRQISFMEGVLMQATNAVRKAIRKMSQSTNLTLPAKVS